jgi:hypothetical protein
MRIELWIILISGLFIYDTYHEHKYSKIILSYKKYYKIILIAIGTIFVYYLFKKKPEQFKNLIKSGTNLFRYIPNGKEAMGVINPIIDLTSNQSLMTNLMNNDTSSSQIYGGYHNDADTYQGNNNSKIYDGSNNNMNNTVPIKRNVGETKKRYVASSQDWTCKKCKSKLTHTYEIDHIVALKDGGNNSVENLVALCRECHGQKTAESFLR